MNDEEIIARYSFLPWLRQGIANSIATVDNLGEGLSGQGERATLPVKVIVNQDSAVPVANEVQLIGPGDIIGIDRRAVVRTDPRNFVTDFEPNYLPLIEFYDEDFPWRYTPAKARNKHLLRPWICLIVLTEDEFEDEKGFSDPLPVIQLKKPPEQVLPRPTQTWAWAHVHVNEDLGTEGEADIDTALNNLKNLVKNNPGLAISRLVCPRKLLPNTTYHTFVLPVFETGRRGGLGEEIPANLDGLAPSWENGLPDWQPRFPVYYRWYFRTGERGDFEFLVRLLEPRVLDPKVGIRPMDVQRPGMIPGISEPPAAGLEGALKTPDTESFPWPNPVPYDKDQAKLSGFPEDFQNALAALINLAEDLQSEEGAEGDPIVTPPLYGRWHAAVKRLKQTGNPPWLDQLNLDPRNRVPAGFGTIVIQQLQEELMNLAWQQVGQVEEANKLLKWGQFAREISLVLYRKHFLNLDPDRLLQFTAPVQMRVLGNPSTVHKMMDNSILPTASVSRGFRRVARPRGPVNKKIAKNGFRQPRRTLTRLNHHEIVAAPPKTAPPKQLTLEEISDQLFPPGIPKFLRPLLKYSHWILLLLFLLFVVLNLLFNFIPFASPLFGIIVAAFAAGFEFLRRLSKRWRTAETLQRKNLTPELVENIPPRPGFTLTKPGDAVPDVGSSGEDSVEAANFRKALLDVHQRFQLIKEPPPLPPALNFEFVQSRLITTLNPAVAMPLRIGAMVAIPPSFDNGRRSDPIAPVMAHPDFPRPMYEPLRDISAELLSPNLNLIPQNTISLLETNQPFIEAYMLGLNHEMARELLWREYPTDQRGSYFRQFWDVKDFVNTESGLSPEELTEKLKDIKKIHQWAKQAELGDNGNRQFQQGEEHLVLVIRGDLLKKYPTAVIYAVEAVWLEDGGSRRPGELEKYPVFSAKIDPDITFLGFELTVGEVKGSPNPEDNEPGWFFCIEERAGEPRFGLDVANGPADQTATDWNDLFWGHLAATQEEFEALNYIDLDKPLYRVSVPGSIQWAGNAADMAFILYQVPVRICVHGSEMLS